MLPLERHIVGRQVIECDALNENRLTVSEVNQHTRLAVLCCLERRDCHVCEVDEGAWCKA